jgi:hypothetical protein
MKPNTLLAAVWILVLGALTASAGDLKVKALLFGFDGNRDRNVSPESSVKIKIVDDRGKPVKNCIDVSRSGALNASKWKLEWTSQHANESFKVTDVRRFPSQGNEVAEIVAKLPADLGKASLGKRKWRLIIAGTEGSPALVLKEPDGSIVHIPTLDIEVLPAHDDDVDLIERFKPVEPNIAFGGGDDGAIFSIDFSYRSAAILTDDYQLYGMHGQFEGSFTPDPGESLLMYGRYSGEFGAFRTWGIPENDLATGSLYFDLNSRFESDQQTDNYNWTLGTGVWAFIGFKPLTLFSKGLYSAVNLGHGDAMTEPPVLTAYLGYEHILNSEAEAGTAAQGDDRMRFLVRYRTPLWRDVDLPILPTVFDVDGVVDFRGVWDFDEGRVLPEVKAGVEFMPRSITDGKLAFSVNYVSGKISPTFVDEDAFLAGLKLRF